MPYFRFESSLLNSQDIRNGFDDELIPEAPTQLMEEISELMDNVMEDAMAGNCLDEDEEDEDEDDDAVIDDPGTSARTSGFLPERLREKPENDKENEKEKEEEKSQVEEGISAEIRENECGICSKSFATKINLEQHVANHEKSRRFGCDVCGKVFFHPKLLQSHERYHKDLDNEIECDLCGISLRGKRALYNHVKTVHEDKRKKTIGKRVKFYCDSCQKCFGSMKTLTSHKKAKHGRGGGNRDIRNNDFSSCRVCGKLFGVRKHLELHLTKEHGSVECDVCGKTVKNLVRHQLNVHNPGGGGGVSSVARRSYECPDEDCEKEFLSAYAAKCHYTRFHREKNHDDEEANKKKKKCGVCDKSYFNLRRHEKEVHGENRFECKICGNFFPVQYSLDRHVKNVHGAKRIPCPFCEKEVIHLALHLTTGHGMANQEAKQFAEEISGKSAARTDLQFIV